MKYFLITVCFLCLPLYSDMLNSSILNIQSTMIPKLILMDRDIDKKTINNSITIAIYHEEDDFNSALLLKNTIEEKYKNGIGKYNFKCNLIPYSSAKHKKTSAIYLLPSNSKYIKSVVDYANNHSIITLALSVDDLKNNVLISIDIDKKVSPVLNFKALKQSKISLRDILLRIAKRYQ